MRSKVAEIAAKLVALSSSAQKEKSDNKRRRLVKGQGPSGAAELAQVDSIGGSLSVTPSTVQVDVVMVNEASPPRQAGGEQTAEPAVQTVGATDSSASVSRPKLARRQGKELVEMTVVAGEEATLPQPAEARQAADAATSEGGFRWPFRHHVSELGEGVWEEVKAALIGDTAPVDSHREVVPEGSRFVAPRLLDKESSVLESSTAHIRAMEQFALPRDVEMLHAIPSMGLHLALKSYLLRGAIIEHELFSRLSYAYELPADFEKKLAEEKKDREMAEERVAALEIELHCKDSKWCRELEMKEDMIKGYKTHL